MNVTHCIERMDRFRHILSALKLSITPEEASFKPSEDDWSITEIVSHMYDIEV